MTRADKCEFDLPRSGDRAGGAFPSLAPPASAQRLGHAPQLALEVAELVPESRGVLEPQVGRRLVHLVGQGLDQLGEVLLGKVTDPGNTATAASTAPASLGAQVGRRGRIRRSGLRRASHLDDVADLLADRLRVDAVLDVVSELELAAPVRLVDGAAHRVGERVGVHHHGAVDVAGRPADRLHERRLRSQEAFLVGVEDGHQRHLRQVQPLPQQVDADERVVLPQPQLAQDLDALHRVDLGVQVAHPQP